MKRLEKIISAYWEVGTALRHPDAPSLSTERAFQLLRESDFLRPTEWKLSANMHIIRFDIIEGNTEWRQKDIEKQKELNSKLIHFTIK